MCSSMCTQGSVLDIADSQIYVQCISTSHTAMLAKLSLSSAEYRGEDLLSSLDIRRKQNDSGSAQVVEVGLCSIYRRLPHVDLRCEASRTSCQWLVLASCISGRRRFRSLKTDILVFKSGNSFISSWTVGVPCTFDTLELL